MDDIKIPMGCPGEGDVEASNWSMRYFLVLLSLLENVYVRGKYLFLKWDAKHDTQ